MEGGRGGGGGRTRSWSRCFGNKAHAIVGARNLWTWSKLRLRLHNSTSVDRYERNGQSRVILPTVHVTSLRDRNSNRLDPTLDQPVRPPYRVLSPVSKTLFFFLFSFFRFLDTFLFRVIESGSSLRANCVQAFLLKYEMRGILGAFFEADSKFLPVE